MVLYFTFYLNRDWQYSMLQLLKLNVSIEHHNNNLYLDIRIYNKKLISQTQRRPNSRNLNANSVIRNIAKIFSFRVIKVRFNRKDVRIIELFFLFQKKKKLSKVGFNRNGVRIIELFFLSLSSLKLSKKGFNRNDVTIIELFFLFRTIKRRIQ